MHTPPLLIPITEAPYQRVRATSPSKARKVNGVLIGSRRNNAKNASQEGIHCLIDAKLKRDILLMLTTPRERLVYSNPQQKLWGHFNTPHPKGSATQPPPKTEAPATSVRVAVTFVTPLVTHAWEPSAAEVSSEPKMDENDNAIHGLLIGK